MRGLAWSESLRKQVQHKYESHGTKARILSEEFGVPTDTIHRWSGQFKWHKARLIKTTLKRKNYHPSTSGGQLTIRQALLGLGVPREKIYRPSSLRAWKREIPYTSFWEKPQGEHMELYLQAKDLYRVMMKKYHPDKTGDGTMAVSLNECWARVNQLYKQRKIL